MQREVESLLRRSLPILEERRVMYGDEKELVELIQEIEECLKEHQIPAVPV
jgi:hypothetical protein